MVETTMAVAEAVVAVGLGPPRLQSGAESGGRHGLACWQGRLAHRGYLPIVSVS